MKDSYKLNLKEMYKVEAFDINDCFDKKPYSVNIKRSQKEYTTKSGKPVFVYHNKEMINSKWVAYFMVDFCGKLSKFYTKKDVVNYLFIN